MPVLRQDYVCFLTEAGGLAAQVETEPLRCAGQTTDNPMYDFLRSYSWSISGGSNEIMRNVIAERLLGLPR